MTIPLNAIDPAAEADRWLRSFEHHLELVPPIMEAIVTTTIPHIRASQTDKEKLTGGGVVDNMTAFLAGVDVDGTGRITDIGADAQHLWWWVVSFTRAVVANIIPSRPAPILDDKPNPDPLTARSTALLTVGWFVDQAAAIEQLTVYESDIDEMFTEIPHLRRKCGVHAKPRRPRVRCRTCGMLAVVVTWGDARNGSPKPVRAGKCRECDEEYRDAREPVDESHAASREVRSPECADLRHEICRSVRCECACHEVRVTNVVRFETDHVLVELAHAACTLGRSFLTAPIELLLAPTEPQVDQVAEWVPDDGEKDADQTERPSELPARVFRKRVPVQRVREADREDQQPYAIDGGACPRRTCLPLASALRQVLQKGGQVSGCGVFLHPFDCTRDLPNFAIPPPGRRSEFHSTPMSANTGTANPAKIAHASVPMRRL